MANIPIENINPRNQRNPPINNNGDNNHGRRHHRPNNNNNNPPNNYNSYSNNNNNQGGNQGGDNNGGGRNNNNNEGNGNNGRGNDNNRIPPTSNQMRGIPPPRINNNQNPPPPNNQFRDFPDTNSVPDDNEVFNAMQQMQYKLEKKYTKSRDISVQSPSALAYKLMATEVSNRTSMNKTAILHRSISPKDTNFQKILKNPSLIKPDTSLVLNSLIALFNNAIKSEDRAGRIDIGDQLSWDKYILLEAFTKDSLLCFPDALNSALESLVTMDPSLQSAADLVFADRNSNISLQSNIQQSVNRSEDICMDYNVGNICSKCTKHHHCCGPHKIPQNHRLIDCPNLSRKPSISRHSYSMNRRRSSGNGYYNSRPHYNDRYQERAFGDDNDRYYENNNNRARFAQGRR